MSLRKIFSLNDDLVTKGRGYQVGDSTFLIAYSGPSNLRNRKANERIFAEHIDAIKHDALSDEKADQLLLDAFVESILIGWVNVKEKDFEAGPVDSETLVPYSKESAKKLMLELPELYAELRKHAGEAKHFRKGDPEAVAKN